MRIGSSRGRVAPRTLAPSDDTCGVLLVPVVAPFPNVGFDSITYTRGPLWFTRPDEAEFTQTLAVDFAG